MSVALSVIDGCVLITVGSRPIGSPVNRGCRNIEWWHAIANTIFDRLVFCNFSAMLLPTL